MTDRFLRACRREPVDRTPLWIMRQAGRYLPEYRELRQRVDFLTLCRTPELAAEASLQPLRRFPLDAAIVFSDILLPLESLGVEMTFSPGPRIARPVRTRADVNALAARSAEEAGSCVGETIRLLNRELAGRTPVIGFCGAPFTLAAYLVQGEGKEGFGALKTLLYRDGATVDALLELLASAMTPTCGCRWPPARRPCRSSTRGWACSAPISTSASRAVTCARWSRVSRASACP
jgi:uroporphyrinogen decarboxylase